MVHRILSDAEEAPTREALEFKARALRDALIEGEQSDEATPFDGEAFLARMHEKHGCDAT